MTPAQLKKWRKSLGFSQAQAATALGIKSRQYSNLERGTSRISRTMELLIKLLKRTDE